jgi:hypothetical protein
LQDPIRPRSSAVNDVHTKLLRMQAQRTRGGAAAVALPPAVPSASAPPARLAEPVPPTLSAAASPLRAAAAPAAPADGGLSAEELTTLRVVELDCKVRVLADTTEHAVQDIAALSPSRLTMSVLCEDATVKIFPRHVVFSRPNGSPVVEIVILELFELTEDDGRGALTFYLQRVNGVAVISVATESAAARAVIYKLVCAKRNQLEPSA